MKKYAALIALVVLLALPAKSYAYYHECGPVLASSGGTTPVWAFLGFVSFAAFIVYANAEGIDFPLCGFEELACEYSYPVGKNGLQE